MKTIRTRLREPLWGLLFCLVTATAWTQVLAGDAGGASSGRPRAELPPGQVLALERIDIQGITKTERDVILRLMTVTMGDPINQSIIVDNLRRLQQSHYFKDVSLFTQPGTAQGMVILVVEITERRWPFLAMEGGNSQLDGWYLNLLSIRADNQFGNGYHMGLNFLLGDRIAGVNLKFRDPWFLGTNSHLNVEAFSYARDVLHYFGQDQIVHPLAMGGIKLEWGGNSGLLGPLRLGYRGVNFRPDSLATNMDAEDGEDSKVTDFPAVISGDTAQAKLSAFSVSIYHDSRDNRYFPTGGFWGNAWAEWAHPRFRGDLEFTKYGFDARAYQGIGRRSAVALRLSGAMASQSTPYYERFYLGGANLMRGYRERSLTPLGWGTVLAFGSLEYRFPLGKRNFPRHRWTGVIFVDGGGLWADKDHIDQKDIYTAAGFGVRVRLPLVGLVRLDIAYPLNYRDKLAHLSLGHAF